MGKGEEEGQGWEKEEGRSVAWRVEASMGQGYA